MSRSGRVIHVCGSLFFDLGNVSFTGLWVLLILSLSGVVFLSIIAYLLKSNSLYIKVGKENEAKKESLSEGVIGAVVMYALTACVASYYLYKSKHQRRIDSQTLEHFY
jgi:divalent metal cation (Fe/Co/Zn/Cd) transporter